MHHNGGASPMTAATHVSFGVLFAEFVLTCCDTPPTGASLVAAGLGALLPDIDTPKSALGRWLPISAIIERRVGHRQLTHSVAFLALCAVALVPLALVARGSLYVGLLLGIASHLLLDMVTVSGVPLLYPYAGRFVFPEPVEARIEVGSRREWVLAAVLLVLALACTPLSFIGYKSLFYRLSQNPYWAIEEAKRHAPTHELTMEVDGVWRTGQAPIRAQFRLLAVLEQGFIAAQGPKVYFLSHTPDTAILIRKLKLTISAPITKTLRTQRLDYQLFDEVPIPAGSVASGYVFFEGFEGIAEILYDVGESEYRTLRIDPHLGHKLLVSFCPAEVLERLKGRGLFISHGELVFTEHQPR
jgi:inner membrane protein